jgi:hypothetical protein
LSFSFGLRQMLGKLSLFLVIYFRLIYVPLLIVEIHLPVFFTMHTNIPIFFIPSCRYSTNSFLLFRPPGILFLIFSLTHVCICLPSSTFILHCRSHFHSTVLLFMHHKLNFLFFPSSLPEQILPFIFRTITHRRIEGSSPPPALHSLSSGN